MAKTFDVGLEVTRHIGSFSPQVYGEARENHHVLRWLSNVHRLGVTVPSGRLAAPLNQLAARTNGVTLRSPLRRVTLRCFASVAAGDLVVVIEGR